jgi:hypothetical protein
VLSSGPGMRSRWQPAPAQPPRSRIVRGRTWQTVGDGEGVTAEAASPTTANPVVSLITALMARRNGLIVDDQHSHDSHL